MVTGASGFLGRHLVAAMLEQGREVTALCRRPESLAGLRQPALRIAVADIRDAASVAALLPPGGSVFHLAGVRNQPHVPAREMREVNVDATLALARRARQRGVGRFVHLATALVYGPADGMRPRTEQDDLAAHAGAYVQSKADAVRGVRQLAREGLPLVTACPTIVFGPDDPAHPNRVTGEIRRLLRGGTRIWVAGGRQRRNLVFVSDVVRGLLAAEELGGIGEEYVLGGAEISPRELGAQVAAVARTRGRPGISLPAAPALLAAGIVDRCRGYDREAGYAGAVRSLLHEWRFSSGKAGRDLGYQPSPLAEGLARTIDWLRASEER